MRFIFLFILLLGSTLNTVAQEKAPQRKVKGNGNAIERDRRVLPFERIEVIGNIDVILLNNDFQKKISLSGDVNLQALIRSKVENGTLTLTFNNNIHIISQTEPLKVRIPSKNIKEIILKDGAKLTNLGAIEGLQLKLSASDNSVADLRIKTDELILNVEGDAELKLNGSSNIIKINHKGTKDIDAKELSNFYTEIEIEGPGSIYSNTVNGIDGEINGSGNLYYKATKTVNVKENSSGKAEKY